MDIHRPALLCPLTNQFFGNSRRYIKKNHHIRTGKLQFFIFHMIQPGKELFPLSFIIVLRHLVNHIARRVPIGNHDPPVFIERFPLHSKRSKTIHRIEHGRRIRIHIPRRSAEITVQVHFHQRRGRTSIIRKRNMHDIFSTLNKMSLQKS